MKSRYYGGEKEKVSNSGELSSDKLSKLSTSEYMSRAMAMLLINWQSEFRKLGQSPAIVIGRREPAV